MIVSPAVEKVAGGFEFVEGPVWLSAGDPLTALTGARAECLIFSDIPASRLYWYRDGQTGILREATGQANGNTLDAGGGLLSCEHQNRRISRMDGNGIIKVLADRFQGRRLNSPNDVVTRSDGMIFFTDPPYGVDADDCHAACEGMNVVVHCAAMHEASAIAKDPLSSIELNVTGTLNLLHAAIATGVKRFVFLSSAKVFGEPATLPSVESDVAIPQNTYGLSKLASEYHCHTLQAQANIQIVIVRPFSVYGPAQELDSGYVGMILSSLLGNTELNLPGRPDFIRDFVYIDDVIRLCSAVVTADLPGITIFNAGSGKQTSLRELLVLAAKISGVDLDGHYRVPGAGTLLRMQACMKHAEAKLGYRPKYDLGEGLAETIDWFLRNRLVAGKVAGK